MFPIELRIWDKVAKKMYFVDKGFYDSEYADYSFSIKVGDSRRWDIEKNDLIVTHYIGLEDTEGRKLFDGDLMKDRNGNIRDIHWGVKEAGWCSKCLSDTGSHPEFDNERISYGWILTRDCKKFGNVFANPEIEIKV